MMPGRMRYATYLRRKLALFSWGALVLTVLVGLGLLMQIAFPRWDELHHMAEERRRVAEQVKALSVSLDAWQGERLAMQERMNELIAETRQAVDDTASARAEMKRDAAVLMTMVRGEVAALDRKLDVLMAPPERQAWRVSEELQAVRRERVELLAEVARRLEETKRP